jgi:hypothetical protein
MARALRFGLEVPGNQRIASTQLSSPASVGIIANPVSARDIRRIIANASNLQTSVRVNIVLRVLTTLAAGGIDTFCSLSLALGFFTLLPLRMLWTLPCN